MSECIGVDIHRKFVQVCLMNQDGQVGGQRRIEMDDLDELTAFFGALAPRTPVAMEATCGWMWLCDLLESMDLDVHVAHMRRMRLIAQSRNKTDKIDARVLAEQLRTGGLPEAYKPPMAVRNRRELLRYRQKLVSWRSAAKNFAHALLIRHNLQSGLSDTFSPAGRRWLREVELPDQAGWVLGSLLEMVAFLDGQIQGVEQEVEGLLEPDERVEWLRSLPGIGRLTAYYLLSEIGEIGRFASPASLAVYCGTTPSTHQSGSRTRHGSTRGGANTLLKWALIQAAHGAVRKRDAFPGSTFRCTSRRKGKSTAYVAVARKLAKLVWHVLSEKREYRVEGKQAQQGTKGKERGRVDSRSRMTV